MGDYFSWSHESNINACENKCLYYSECRGLTWVGDSWNYAKNCALYDVKATQDGTLRNDQYSYMCVAEGGCQYSCSGTGRTWNYGLCLALGNSADQIGDICSASAITGRVERRPNSRKRCPCGYNFRSQRCNRC